MKPLIITPGEPAGIGPDIVIQLLAQHPHLPVTLVMDRNLLMARADQLNIKLPAHLQIHHIPLSAPCEAGFLNPDNAAYVLECLNQAIEACLARKFHALVTGPIHKGIINKSGVSFSGHTEYLAQKTNSPLPVMLLTSESMRVALVTTHLPLADVPKAITAERIKAMISIIHQDLDRRFGLPNPRIHVCGLNPHAGENGYLGREEIDIITPALSSLQQSGYNIRGPLPADTAFTPQALSQCDVILAMYHDQGLPVIKSLNFSSAVNVTLGLPIIRTSVDHGSALELAGSGKADFSSLLSAIQMAQQLKE